MVLQVEAFMDSCIGFLSLTILSLTRGTLRRKVEKAQKIIDDSGCICIFGMSFGKTDLMWWKYIFEWLKKSSKHRLVLYKRYKTPLIAGASALARRRNLARKEFLSLVGAKDEDNRVANQIIVIPNTNVFTYEKIKVVEDDG